MRLVASVRSGPGRLSVEGWIGFDPGGQKVDLAISGRRFQASNTREADVLVDPDLRVRMEGTRMDVSGQVAIPRGRIAVGDLAASAAIPVSGDVVYEGTGADTTLQSAGAIHARVRVILGDSISFSAQGLKARPTGSILAIDEPGKPTTGTGELVLRDGTYKAYGQELTIDRGRLFFGGGPIENPGLDVRASRRARDGVVAGFEIRGTLQAPELKLFSEPALTESDALAYIVLGHPLEKATSGEQNLVTDAATSLGLQGGSLLAGRLARRIGVEEARIESEGSIEDASLLLGTFLSPRIYVNYGIGLMEPVSTFRVRYLLSRKWTVQVKTAEENSADIMYSIEH